MPKKEVALPKSTARILMVDDNGAGLIARKSVLEELGHEITIVCSPLEALNRFADSPYDIVVTDFKMPGMNGIELVQRLKKIRADVPVILISGFTDALGLDEATTGADIVLQKSAQEVTQLIRGVGRLLKKSPKKPPRSESATASAASSTAATAARRRNA